MSGLGQALDAGERWLLGAKRATYGLATMRIVVGLAILGSLVVNFSHRHYVWGPGARWLDPWLVVDSWGWPFTAVFSAEDSPAVFTLKYLGLFVVAVLFTVGWRTRVVTPILLLLLASMMRLNPLASDAGDNLIRIVLLFMCFADVSHRWSVDAVRRRRSSRGGRWAGRPAWLGVVLHNVALLGIAFQVFVVYVVSGLSKVQGSMWQEGVGLYYPLRMSQYASWPALNELIYAVPLVVTVGSYLTVFVQVFFPLLLMRRGTRIVALVVVFGLHVGIAVTMALPWFSLAILAADAIFIRDVTYEALIRRWRTWRDARRADVQTEPDAAPPDELVTAG